MISAGQDESLCMQTLDSREEYLQLLMEVLVCSCRVDVDRDGVGENKMANGRLQAIRVSGA